MSDQKLHMFGNTNLWRENLKTFLLMERNTSQQSFEAQTVNKKSDKEYFKKNTESDSQQKHNMFNNENKENNHEHNMLNWMPSKKKKDSVVMQNLHDTVVDKKEVPHWECTSDESFEVMERMCNKTASDPNSTLFAYLHSDNKEKEMVVANAKTHSPDKELSNDCIIKNLFDGLKLGVNKNAYNSIDDLQIEDIEAPSKLWENTIDAETTIQTSPVKMVRLMRPSTILEECTEDNYSGSENSYLTSVSPLSKDETASEASSSYKTANDSPSTAFPKNKYNVQENRNCPPYTGDLINLDTSNDLIYLDNRIPTKQISYQSKVEETPKINDQIILDQTLMQEFEKNEKQLNESSFEDSVIDIASDDDDDDDSPKYIEKPDQLDQDIKKESVDGSMCSSYEAKDSKIDKYLENSSMNFNDTLEEVDYMLKKGLEYMAATNSPAMFNVKKFNSSLLTPKEDKKNTLFASPQKPKTFTLSTKSNNYASPKLKCNSNCEKLIPMSNSNPLKRFALDIKPIPKFDVFKTPLPSLTPKCKQSTKSQFAHVVSPVGTYIKKTGTTPFMTQVKSKCSNLDILNSSTFQNVEKQSRLMTPMFKPLENNKMISSPIKLSGIPTTARTLPKKAYISSELKHVVDERTPMTIPGGSKIQQYIEPALIPAVVRHDGKLKMCEVDPELNIPKIRDSTTSNASLIDLSIVSGDISVYTIRDAQKF